jgi:uncharacterized protein YdeI (YjbR/CyaY-like superfamily)
LFALGRIGILMLPMPAQKSAHRRSTAKTFRAVLEPLSNGLGWIVARVPFDVAKAWPERRGSRVRGEINGFTFRTSLFSYPGGEGRMLLVNKTMQKGAKASPGAMVDIRLEPDFEERPALMPPELAAALKGDRRLRKWFDGLSEYTRRTFGALVNEAKSPEARIKRAESIAERLLLALEGEQETPPVLRAAFQRQPLAEAGWKAMTVTQRRGHLLGIFYYQTAQGRENRTARAVEAALDVARKKRGNHFPADDE